MAQSDEEAPLHRYEIGLGKEFDLPNISGPWLTEVFQLRNDKNEAGEALHPTADFQTGRDMQVQPVESAVPDSKIGKKRVAVTPIADLSHARTRSQIWSEPQGKSSSSVDSSMWDDASAQTEVVSSSNAVQGHLNGSERGVNREGDSQSEVGART